jgi:hypothetical protein
MLEKCLYQTNKEEQEHLLELLLQGEWINYQNMFFSFNSDEERTEFIEAYPDDFHDTLFATNYHGCGDAYINLDTLKLVWHEQTDEDESRPEETNIIKKVYCSSWQIQLKEF